MLKRSKNIFTVTVLVLVDLFIKLIISNFFMNKKFRVFDIVGFVPYLNKAQLLIL